jgi:hypothetical protein
MKTRAWPITLALFACFADFAAADLRFLAPAVDLGDARACVPMAHEFHFVNDGPDTVTLLQVLPGCGCLRPRLDQLRFAPGEHGSIPLEIHTLGQAAGPHRWYLTVIYADGAAERDIKLEVSANVVTEVSVQPVSLTLFAEGSVTHEVMLTDLRPQPLVIERVVATSPNLRVDAGPLEKDAFGHWTSRIRVQTAGELSIGRQDEVLTIYTSDPLYRELKVAVAVIRRGSTRLIATPSEITLGTAPRLVRLWDRQNQAVTIERVTADDPAVVCSWAPGPENQATIKLQADRNLLPGGALHTQIHVEVKCPVREDLTIPVTVSND